MRCMTGEKPSEWALWLPLTEWCYNTTYHSVIQTTPYEALYGNEAFIHLPYLAGTSKVEKVDRSLQHKEAMKDLLKFHLKRSQDRMKQIANRKRSNREFQVEDLVYLRL